MKTTLNLLILTICSLGLSSCCSLMPCGSSSGKKKVTTLAKGQDAASVVSTTRTKRVTSSCSSCGSVFHPTPGRCGSINNQVRARASAQASGEPHIGLIPTMKDLVPSD